jgi:hypothetical protein
MMCGAQWKNAYCKPGSNCSSFGFCSLGKSVNWESGSNVIYNGGGCANGTVVVKKARRMGLGTVSDVKLEVQPEIVPTKRFLGKGW